MWKCSHLLFGQWKLIESVLSQSRGCHFKSFPRWTIAEFSSLQFLGASTQWIVRILLRQINTCSCKMFTKGCYSEKTVRKISSLPITRLFWRLTVFVQNSERICITDPKVNQLDLYWCPFDAFLVVPVCHLLNIQ